MESDDRERLLNLLPLEESGEVLTILRDIDEEEQAQTQKSVIYDIEEIPEPDIGYDHEIEYKEYEWLNIVNPTPEDQKNLSEELNIPLDFLASPMDTDERSRVEVEGKNILVIIRTPYFDEGNDIQYITTPLGMIFTDDMILTVSANRNDVIQAFARGRMKSLSTVSRTRFLLQVFSATALIYLDYLKQINKQTSLAEDKLQKSMKNQVMIELLNLEKSLVYFATSLRSNEIVLDRIHRTKILDIDTDDMDLLEDVLVENKQAIDMTNIHSDILSGMMDAFASVISNNLNRMLKFLTTVTIILTFPTWVVSVYGMNIKLPFQESSYAFAIVMGVSVILSTLGGIIFIRHKSF